MFLQYHVACCWNQLNLFIHLLQILPATRVSAITSLSPQPGSDLLLVASGGSPGNRQLSVDVYRFTDPESVALVQQLPGLGVTDLVSFSAGGQWYVLVANGEDNTGSNIVDSTVWWWNGTAFVMSQVSKYCENLD